MKLLASLRHTLAALAVILVVQNSPAMASGLKYHPIKAKVTKAKPTARSGQASKHQLHTPGKTRNAKGIAEAKVWMNDYIAGTGQFASVGADTPEMVAFLETPGAMTKTREQIYERGVATAFTLSGMTDGNAKFTALLPVSGHTGFAAAKQYAASNVYEVQVVHPDGRIEKLPNVKSTGLITQTEISARLQPGLTKLQFWPQGSGGIGGYYSGRTIELTWAGN